MQCKEPTVHNGLESVCGRAVSDRWLDRLVCVECFDELTDQSREREELLDFEEEQQAELEFELLDSANG